MSVKDRDFRLLSRYVDGEMGDVERVRFEERLTGEPELRAALEEIEAGRDWFRAGRSHEGATVTAPAGFSERVLREARRLPEAGESHEAGQDLDARRVSTLVRRLTLAALLILGAAIVFTAILWKQGDPSELQASPGEIQKELEQLDQEISRQRQDSRR